MINGLGRSPAGVRLGRLLTNGVFSVELLKVMSRGLPVWTEKIPFACQSPRIQRPIPECRNFLFGPNGRSQMKLWT